ncbi:hypothetical protein Tco_1427365 [Tanacetum coccineum]
MAMATNVFLTYLKISTQYSTQHWSHSKRPPPFVHRPSSVSFKIPVNCSLSMTQAKPVSAIIKEHKGFSGTRNMTGFSRFGLVTSENKEAKSKLLEAAKLYVHIGLNTYLGKINIRVPISSYELSTLNSASNVVLEGNWVSHSHIGISCIKFLSHSASLPTTANATSIVEPAMHVYFLEAHEMAPPPSRNTHSLVEDESST